VDEDENTGEDVNLQQASGTDSGNGQNDGSSKPKHKGGKGKAARDFSGIQFVDGYDYDTEKLLEKYGPDARVVRDNTSISVIYIRAHFVVVVKHRPTIAYSSGPDTKMVTVRSKPSLWLNSYATPSLVAHIIYERFFLCITYCRIEKEFADLGFTLGRQTMSSWLIRVAFDFLKPVWEHLKNRLLKQPYNQCDETTEEVINDGRKAGSTSFVWFHSSSELYAKPFTPGEPCLNPPIIWACFELTRGTDHLRATYKGYKGIITCDGYGAYKLLEKESQEDGGSQGIHTSGCMMHMRRRFASSYRMTKPANLSKEASRALPEYKALVLIRDFYIEEGKLKELSPEERKKKRNEKVRPKVDAFYAYIESLDTNDPLMSETLKEAVQYAINQKDSLTLFLDDGNIPIDNGFVERAIRPFTILRRNSLFCTSIEGAEAAAIIYSIVATARANKVRVDVYLEYLLEKVPKTLDAWGKCDDAAMETMMPWSEEYREYEKQHASRPSGPSGVPLWPDMYKEEVADMPDEPIPEEPATPPPQSDAA
ncbi:MAG: IS66 family transposase, partial [Clostridia bacterium]|nr:IS66 family transposase [Clostridia bacterium]